MDSPECDYEQFLRQDYAALARSRKEKHNYYEVYNCVLVNWDDIPTRNKTL